jgi:hypothetical protein
MVGTTNNLIYGENENNSNNIVSVKSSELGELYTVQKSSGFISTLNSSTTLLGISGIFTGTGESIKDYGSVIVSVFSDVSSATGGLSVQFSSNGTNWDFSFNFTIIAGEGQQRTFPVEERFFRVVYTNGETTQTTFRLDTIFNIHKTNGSSSTILGGSGTLAGSTLVNSTNTSLYGLGENDRIAPIRVSGNGALYASIKQPLSAFGLLPTVSYTLVEALTFRHNINTTKTESTVVGSGTVTQSDNFAVIASGITIGSTAIMRSIKVMTYIPSVGINIKFTALFTSPVAGTTQYIGYGTTTDGLFFGYNGTSFGVVIRNNSVDTFIEQTSWNVDKFNGTGISGINLNPLYGNVYEIKFQWLGFGSIFFSIENPNLGEFTPVHIVKYGNTSLVTSINYPNGYLWVEAKNGSTTSNMIIKTPSLSMVYEGVVSDTYGVRNNYFINKLNID